MPDGRQILVVEDDADLRTLYSSALRVAGYEVESVADGLDALYHLDSELPALVVLDIGLPRISGRTVYEEIASQSRTRRIPIVVVTGDPGDLREKKWLCILRKPVDLDALVTTVQDCLERAASRRRTKRTVLAAAAERRRTKD
ncbi:MAG TPA: response regulator [Vicinamibacterales bacterium]|nr:response regulator [Vicinamibacterales bacterium]